MGMIDEWLIAETATYISLCQPLSRKRHFVELGKLLEIIATQCR
jgi:hypothetical protein